MRSAVGCAVAIAAVGLFAAGRGSAAIWTEVGDAGDAGSPQVTKGVGELTEIHGEIGNGDNVDAFLFGFAGGELHLALAFDTPQDPQLVLSLTVFDETGSTELGSALGELTLTGLPAGLYIAGVFLDDDGADPPYTLTLGAGAHFAVPEPSALSLAGAGLVALGLRRARTRRAS